jgi:5-methylcytosine-specific restriction protein B
LDRSTFSGGEKSTAFRILRDLGFHVEPKRIVQDLVTKFLAQSKTTELAVREYPESYRELAIRVSFGKGNIARIPWIAFLADGEQVPSGIYPALLFYREQRVLLLCYGISEENPPDRTWKNIDEYQSVNEWFESKFGVVPDRYGESRVKASYAVDQSPNLDDLAEQVDRMIAEYLDVVGKKSQSQDRTTPPAIHPRLEIRTDLRAAVDSFSSALREANVSFGESHIGLVRAILASLATKPFLILTGLSGSGKTQVAIRLGEWLGSGRLLVAAVRPDWTGSEAVFGYEDGLRKSDGGRAAWAVPPTLEFMLRAARDPQHPYLLLLDEMNLAHVERYFADVLSGMESGQPCLPNVSKEPDGCWRIPVHADAAISLPRNLWIIGTVNVDETTYMFSPKVLDRANVFEFRVATADLIDTAGKPSQCATGNGALVRGLLAIGSGEANLFSLPSELSEVLSGLLRRLHELLSRYGMEFGHRTFYEARRFAALMHHAGATDIEANLDRIVLQRILPRLHGARRRLETPLLALALFARELPTELPPDEKLAPMSPERLGGGIRARLPLTYEKIVRMLRSLRANQFASFAE